jgi:hypothetical protein
MLYIALQCELVLLFVSLLWLPSVWFCKLVKKLPNIPMIGYLRQQRNKRCVLYRFAVGPKRRILLWKCALEFSEVEGKAANLFHPTLVISLIITTSPEYAPTGTPPGPRQYRFGDASLN